MLFRVPFQVLATVYTIDNQPLSVYLSRSLGGVWSQVRILSPRLRKALKQVAIDRLRPVLLFARRPSCSCCRSADLWVSGFSRWAHVVSGIECGQPEHEEFYIADSPELRSECLYLGVERFGSGICEPPFENSFTIVVLWFSNVSSTLLNSLFPKASTSLYHLARFSRAADGSVFSLENIDEF